MTSNVTVEHLQKISRSLHTHRVEVIQDLCTTGLSPDQAKEIWLYSVLNDCCIMAEYWSIPIFRDIPQDSEMTKDSELYWSTKSGLDIHVGKERNCSCQENGKHQNSLFD